MNRWLTRDKSYYQSLVTLAIPVALQNLVTFLVTFADNYMVTKLGDTRRLRRVHGQSGPDADSDVHQRPERRPFSLFPPNTGASGIPPAFGDWWPSACGRRLWWG